MATLNSSITGTTQEFDGFADKLGYMTQVFDIDGVASPNPESRNDFILRTMKEVFAEKFYAPYVADIDREVRTEREADKEAMRENIRARITMSFT